MSSTPAATPVAATYTIEPAHSSAHFKVRHLMIANVRGEFSKVGGTVTVDPSNPAASSITAEIDVNSINTREPDRDKHLKSADFFDAANHPAITFQSKTVAADGPEAYNVTGDLAIRGVTHEVVLHVTGPTPEIKDPACPPNSFRMADRMRFPKSPSPREEKRANKAADRTSAGTPSS